MDNPSSYLDDYWLTPEELKEKQRFQLRAKAISVTYQVKSKKKETGSQSSSIPTSSNDYYIKEPMLTMETEVPTPSTILKLYTAPELTTSSVFTHPDFTIFTRI